MSTKDFKENMISLTTAIISIAMLIASIVYFLNTHISDSEISKMETAAENLVVANFDTAAYFGIASLDTNNDYIAENYLEGSAPCSNNIFGSYQELSNFIKNTYTPATAAILLGSESNGTKRYFDYNGQLCMAIVQPDLTYNKDWSNFKINLNNITTKSADIVVTVNLKDSAETTELNLKMVKFNDTWLLDNFVY